LARLIIGTSLRRYFERWSFVRKILWLIEAGVLWTFLMFARILPTDRATGVGRRLMMGVGPKLEKQRIVRRNLALAFPHKNEREIEELATSVRSPGRYLRSRRRVQARDRQRW
jgi:lauroyl/myristoyl acyltransferase